LSNPVWKDLVSCGVQCAFESVAAKILQVALARSVAEDPSPENLLACARMLRDLFAQNISNPTIQQDLEKIRSLRTPHES
jgi:hypothetical protein